MSVDFKVIYRKRFIIANNKFYGYSQIYEWFTIEGGKIDIFSIMSHFKNNDFLEKDNVKSYCVKLSVSLIPMLA